MARDHVDVLIVGAGLSGIGAGVFLQERCPGKTYAILESRGASGGTWDLFRYPGIRSDSDMHTLGYTFRPWIAEKSIADGDSILDYVRDTARDHGVDAHIRYHHKVVSAAWSSADAVWEVTAERSDTGETVELTCGYLYMCAGYYRYDEGYTPEFPGADRFGGPVIHPQHWPEDLDYTGKKVVVIGSGATAMTLVPAMAKDAEHVTMLQRSPTYVVSMPAKDAFANGLRKVLPDKAAYGITRWKNVIMQRASFDLSRHAPGVMKAMLRQGVKMRLPKGYDIDTHFKPTYNPWDQRLCLVPDGDLFKALRKGTAEVVTDHIESFTETGIALKSGKELEADIIVTATGLNLLAFGGIELSVDEQPVEIPRTMTYKGMMLSGVPNFAFALGYTNASWTLKCDLTSAYLCRLLNFMDAHGHRIATPSNRDVSVVEEPLLDFQSGYVLRALDQFPSQGSKAPWKLRQNYPLDRYMFGRGPVDDGAMVFSSPVSTRAEDRLAA
ncbi:MAG: NAD(P)/FAD-dependent oxidoreductase [Solirubrobacteraceae bacterium]|nr:NAD(P)/FAD-dependent oxidoreductase [Solirubrobacteraceae bacterium]